MALTAAKTCAPLVARCITRALHHTYSSPAARAAASTSSSRVLCIVAPDAAVLYQRLLGGVRTSVRAVTAWFSSARMARAATYERGYSVGLFWRDIARMLRMPFPPSACSSGVNGGSKRRRALVGRFISAYAVYQAPSMPWRFSVTCRHDQDDAELNIICRRAFLALLHATSNGAGRLLPIRYSSLPLLSGDARRRRQRTTVMTTDAVMATYLPPRQRQRAGMTTSLPWYLRRLSPARAANREKRGGGGLVVTPCMNELSSIPSLPISLVCCSAP